jgi:hypothetical protein
MTDVNYGLFPMKAVNPHIIHSFHDGTAVSSSHRIYFIHPFPSLWNFFGRIFRELIIVITTNIVIIIMS